MKLRFSIDEANAAAAVSGAMKEFPDLTYMELMSVLNQIQASWIKWGIRDERHPNDPEKRGGEE